VRLAHKKNVGYDTDLIGFNGLMDEARIQRSLSIVIESASTSSLYASITQQPPSTPMFSKLIDWFKSDKYTSPFLAKPADRYRKISVQCDAILHNRSNVQLQPDLIKRSDSVDQSISCGSVEKKLKRKTVNVSDFDIVMTAPISM